MKRELKSRGLTTTGNKTELIERLQLAVMEEAEDILAETTDHAEKKETSEEPKKRVAIKRDVALPT